MELESSKTKKGYQNALARFEEIFQAKAGAKVSEEADMMAILIKQQNTNMILFRRLFHYTLQGVKQHKMTHTDWIGTFGVTLLLIAYFLNVKNIIEKDSLAYLL